MGQEIKAKLTPVNLRKLRGIPVKLQVQEKGCCVIARPDPVCVHAGNRQGKDGAGKQEGLMAPRKSSHG